MANPPDLLISRKKDPLQVYIQTGALNIQLDGSTVATGVNDEPGNNFGDSQYGYPVQRVVEAFGKRFFVRSGFIHERDQGGAGSWGVVHTFSQSLAAGNPHSGLHVINVNGEETVVCLYVASNNFLQAISSQDGVTWTEVAVADVGQQPRSVGDALGWISAIYWNIWLDGTNHVIVIYDFQTSTLTKVSRIDGGELDAASSMMAIHKGKLFWWGTTISIFPAKHRLRRLDGVSLTKAYTSDHSFLSAFFDGQLISPSVLFTDPGTGDLILMGNESDPADTSNPPSKCGIFCMKLANALTANNLDDTSPDVTDLTTTVLPSFLRSTLNGGTHPDIMQDMMGVYVDTTSTPGTPIPYFYRARTTASGTPSWNQAQSWEWFQWNGVNSVMTGIGSSVADGTNYVIPRTSVGGGAHIVNLGLARFAFDGGPPQEVAGNRIKLFFRVYGSGSANSWAIYFGLDAPSTLKQLVPGTINIESGTPATTPTNTATQIDNVTPDNGVSLYSIQIDGTGIISGSRYFLLAVPV